jgi:hypothetical protein
MNRLTHARVWSAKARSRTAMACPPLGSPNAPPSTPRHSTVEARHRRRPPPLAHHRKHRQVFPLDRIDWMARIVWASQ